MSIFLSQKDLELLTDRKRKSCQIDVLREMGIAFYINASGRPVVLVSSVDNKEPIKPEKKEWQPAVLSK